MQFVFIVCQVEYCANILKLTCRPLVFASYEALLKTKDLLEPVSLPHDFGRKMFFIVFC